MGTVAEVGSGDEVTPREILAAWDAAVAVSKARRRAFLDPDCTVEEYGALAAAQTLAEDAAVKALGGYSRYSLPQLTAWGDAK